jgi:hypothetical protein
MNSSKSAVSHFGIGLAHTETGPPVRIKGKRILSYLRQLLKTSVGGIIAGFMLIYYLQPGIESPKLSVLGLLPIALVEEGRLADNGKLQDHRLGLILKIENNSPTPAIVATAVIQGCVLMDPFAVEVSLPENERLISGRPKEAHFEKYKYTIQRISFSGFIRDDTQVIPGYGTTYVGIAFPFSAEATYLGVPGSVSLAGNCHEIKVVNTQPSLFQIFNQWSPHSRPETLRLELTDGRLKIGLFAGNQWIYIHPRRIKSLQHTRAENWPKLGLAQMYENPDKPPIPLGPELANSTEAPR